MTQQANAVAVRDNPALAPAIEVFDRIAAVRGALAPDLNDQELSLFALVAQRSGLDPFSKQIHAVKRDGRVTFQTGIDGYRSIAERTGEYRGVTEPDFGEMVTDTRGAHPEWARVGVRREGRETQYATAYWDEFVPAPGQSGKGDQMWRKMPRNQLAKCAEALAFRKQFPHVFGDVYTDDEMHQADSRSAADAQAAQVAAIPAGRDRIAARRAQIAQPSQPFADAPQQAPEPEAAPVAAEPVEEAVVAAPCDASSDPALGEVEQCSLRAGHEGQPGPRRHQSASGTVWPVAKAGRS